MTAVTIKNYPAPPIDEREILRYAGCKEAETDVLDLLHACLDEVRNKLVYRVCYTELPLAVTGDTCNLGAFSVQSSCLAKHLMGCARVLLFASTVGIEIDRQIVKYGRLAPSKALMMQAIGTERIEALCDLFCADMQRETGATLTARFSAGYGDLALTAQKDIFAVLGCDKKIGVCLNDSLVMSPSKSVTAFVGIRSK